MGALNHPYVAESSGGGACPEQYWGAFVNGSKFYFRYRLGMATLRIDEAIDDLNLWANPILNASMQIGDDFQGIFDTKAQRDEIFATLFIKLLRRANPMTSPNPHDEDTPTRPHRIGEPVEVDTMSMDMKANADVRYTNAEQPTRIQFIRINAAGLAHARLPFPTWDTSEMLIEADKIARWIDTGHAD